MQLPDEIASTLAGLTRLWDLNTLEHATLRDMLHAAYYAGRESGARDLAETLDRRFGHEMARRQLPSGAEIEQ